MNKPNLNYVRDFIERIKTEIIEPAQLFDKLSFEEKKRLYNLANEISNEVNGLRVSLYAQWILNRDEELGQILEILEKIDSELGNIIILMGRALH